MRFCPFWALLPLWPFFVFGTSPALAQVEEPNAAAPEQAQALVVIVEAPRRAPRPDAIRQALHQRITDSEVVALGASAEHFRARILVAMAPDGSAVLHVTTAWGHMGNTRLDARAPRASNADEAGRIADAIAGLLRETEAALDEETDSRHGLIPWEYDGVQRDDGGELLPWPGAAGNTAGTGPARRRYRELAEGLTVPRPRAQNR